MVQPIKPEVTEKSFKEHINPIIKNPHNAIIELIANSYDAGATEVYINWKFSINDTDNPLIEFRDNGCGMSNEEFRQIWKELSYDRLKKPNGNLINVQIDSDTYIHRKVYGRNGKGRHAPFAFSNKYIVKTIKDNNESIFEIYEDSESGFSIYEKGNEKVNDEPGTTILFKLTKIDNNLSADKIKETIATRFLKDPNFKIYLNDELIELSDISIENKEEFDCTYNGEKIKIIKIKSDINSSYMKFHGISWMFGNRLFTEEWGNILDGRTTIAKTYNFIISAKFLENYLNETMTGFNDDVNVKNIKDKIYDCVVSSLKKDMDMVKKEDKEEIIKENFNSIKNLGIVDKQDIAEFITEVQDKCPTIKKEDLKATTKIFIKLKESHSGYHLLHQLSSLSPTELDKLDEILSKWDISQAKYVLNLIQDRLNFIEVLEKKMNDPSTDELHELQVLFEKGLWVFGPDYESIEFTSNKSLSTVIKNLFKQKEVNVANPKKRPDFVVLPDKSMSVYSSDCYDSNGEVNGIDRLLIIELKKGGFEIGVDETTQTRKYVKELIDGGHISKNTKIDAYVLGSKVNDDPIKSNNVRIIPMQYSVVVRRAEKRLFNLRNKIKEIKNISEKTGDSSMDDIMCQESLDNY